MIGLREKRSLRHTSAMANPLHRGDTAIREVRHATPCTAAATVYKRVRAELEES